MLEDGVTGLDVAKLLNDSLPQHRILIVSGVESAARKKEICDEGYRLHKKPLDIEYLDSIVESALN